MGDLEGLKRVLRSLVVSTPTTIDAATLLRDYRRMVGGPLPVASYGYRDPVLFLREQCADSFLFQGPQSNPVLTLIVNKAIKHIDQYVQSQKRPKQVKGKRRSVPESVIRQPNLIANTFISTTKPEPSKNSFSNNSRNIVEAKSSPSHAKPQPAYTEVRRSEPALVTRPESPKRVTRPESPKLVTRAVPKPEPSDNISELSAKMETLSNGHSEQTTGTHTRQRLQQYLEAYRSQQLSRGSLDSIKHEDDDSGRQTSSSSSCRTAAALAQLKNDIARLVAQHPEPVWCSQLLRLYEEAYGRELNFSRFGFASVSACACAVEALAATRAQNGDWLLTSRGAEPAPALRLRRARRDHHDHASRASLAPLDPDDALPGIDYDPDVFPPDCLSFLESIPASSVGDVAPGDMLAVVVGEVYSPSHLWVLRLGPDYDTMEQYMDEMTEYYTSGEGSSRTLALGARRPGQYCSSVFEGDWHRSLIVQLLDSDTVKVLHVDYGTVDTVAASSLRPLRRQWAALPALAVRAMLAGLRPAAASRRWPRAAAAHCLHLVRERRLVANVVQVDREENILELFLIDTSTEEDVNITEQMIRAGHADPRPLPALGARESYLFPLFRVLEAGETPNYAEIHALLRDGIALEFVDAYRRHVPALLPAEPAPEPHASDSGVRAAADGHDADTSDVGSSAASSPTPPPPPPPAAGNRVPFTMLLPARDPRPLSPPAWVSGEPRSEPEPEPEPGRASVATSTSPPAPAAPPPPPVPKVFVFSAPPARPAQPAATPAAPSIPNSSSPAAPPVSPAAEAPHPCRPTPAAVASPAAGPPQPAGSCRPAHPAAVYALPYCPCSQVSPCCPGPAPHQQPPPPYAFAQTPRFAPPPQPYPYAHFRPEPPRAAPPYYAQAQYPRPILGPSPYYGRDGRAVPAAAVARTGGGGGDGASVRLSGTECEVFEKLSRVDPGTAHRYMIEALRRARAQAQAPPPPPLNPDAPEFRAPPPSMRPPPGFENGPK